jgi:NodT family efflux transporter outer membrane factor (OMF) lipoprotein
MCLKAENESRSSPLPSYLLALTPYLLVLAGGCTPLQEWVQNDFKVGPNFQEPSAAVAKDWIDASNSKILKDSADSGAWWGVFKDAELDSLIESAYRENLDLKTAGTRVLQAQAQRNIAAGNLFPQSQDVLADYAHVQLGKNLNIFKSPVSSLPSNINVFATGFNASWELDFWGRFRRGVESADAEVGASVEDYRAALVTLLADVATNYVQLRTFQQRIVFARRNVEIQKGSLSLAEARLKDGRATELDVKQARSSLAQTEATIPPLAIGSRQANDRLCVLLGLPAQDLMPLLKEGPIPATPPDVAVGLPADLLERRPDVRRALQQVAAQSAQIGVAEADLYPQIGVQGFLGYTSDDIRRLFAEKSFTGVILPTIQWKVLNYGRIINNVRAQDAHLQERIFQYQQAALSAGREVEDALVQFLEYQLQARSLEVSVKEAQDSVELVQAQYKGGIVDFNRVFTTQSQLVTLQDQLTAARGNIALSLIAVYRAMGGGWQIFEKDPAGDGFCWPFPESQNEKASELGKPVPQTWVPAVPARLSRTHSKADSVGQ